MTTFKKILIASAAVSAMLGATQASAADLYQPAPEPAPMATWGGLWLGGGVGYGFVNHELSGRYYENEDIGDGPAFSETIGGKLSGIGGQGWMGRIGAGYDFQMGDDNSGFILGIFGDYSFGDMSSKVNVGGEKCKGNECESASFGSYKLKAENSWFVGGRAGWLMNPNTLIYGLVGYSEFDFKGTLNLGSEGPFGGLNGDNGDYGASYKYSNGGLTWGVGLETKPGDFLGMNTSNWTFKMEYRYHDLDSKNVYSEVFVDEEEFSSGFGIKTATNIQTVMFTANYKFNFQPY
jgi:opacity protein-like surface antigen